MCPLESYKQVLRKCQPVGVTGRVSAVRGLTVSVADFPAPIGAACRIVRGGWGVEARVIGFADESTLIMPLGAMTGIRRGDRVACTFTEQTVGVGPDMLGRVLDGSARPVDGQGPFRVAARVPVWPEPLAPMRRRRITEPLGTGVRAIDALKTVGRGQRMGIFSGSGVGKSVLMGMIGRYTAADVTVVALIGERGREVRDFIEKDLASAGLEKTVVVVSTSDEPPLIRVQAGAVAAAVAEYFRDQGCDVLLLMDSLTRLATAQRQIGLAAGEPPTTRGYTPSVFNLLPQLLERSGRTETGSVTGFYSALVEADDPADPVCEAVRSVTDGHIYLSRDLASRGHYPAVDVTQSVSRIMTDVTDPDHQAAAAEIHRLIALYLDVEDLVNVGAYKSGANAETDLAIRSIGPVREFLAQDVHERADPAQTIDRLKDFHRRLLAERRAARAGTSDPQAAPAAT